MTMYKIRTPIIFILSFLFSLICIMSFNPRILDASSNLSLEISGPDHIIKRQDYITNSQFFLDFFTATDSDNNDITNQITIIQNDYQGNANKTGNYAISLQVEDDEDNKTTHDFTIEVTKNIIPYLIIDQQHMLLHIDEEFSQNDIIETLKTIDEINNETYIFETLFDNYTNNHNKTGIYNLSFYLLSETGEDYYFYLTFEVIDEDLHLIEASPSVFNHIIDWFTSWWWTLIIPSLILIGIKKES